ncbi:hypothetical protein CEXT_501001 [Caerostris extrusa]|uniref:Uncharacterized protein n=1 Tax=Caerostris extrusa TaxID=172846 RepID=A0AAV4M3Z7_CAEEX|nr:hypothetical protein CEXT_501001 [Caerostris extrusa]
MYVEKNDRTSSETKRASSTKPDEALKATVLFAGANCSVIIKCEQWHRFCAILCSEIQLVRGKGGIIGLSRREIILQLPSFNASREVIFIQEATSCVPFDDAKDNLSRRRMECSKLVEYGSIF